MDERDLKILSGFLWAVRGGAAGLMITGVLRWGHDTTGAVAVLVSAVVLFGATFLEQRRESGS